MIIMNLKNYFIVAIAILCFISILPTALGNTVYFDNVNTEAKLLSAISDINAATDAGIGGGRR